MSFLNHLVEVNITKESVPLTAESFDTLMILGDTKNAVSIKAYGSMTEVAADYQTTDTEYKIAQVAFGQSRTPSRVMIGQCKTGEFVDGYNAVKALDNSFYSVVCTTKDNTKQLALADAIEADVKIYGCSSSHADNKKTGDTTQLAYKLKDKAYKRTFGVYTATATDYPEAAILGLAMTHEAGSLNYAHNELSSITGVNLTDGERGVLDGFKCNYPLKFAGRNVFYWGTFANGDKIDIQHGKDKLKNAIQTEIANVFLSNPKVPYNDEGFGLLQTAIKTAFTDSVQSGFLNKDSVVIKFPDLSAISTSDKEARILKNVIVQATLAGAIDRITMNVSLNLN